MPRRSWTEEEKQKQRERMQALHAEGRAGAEFGKLGGRPRKKRPSETIAELAENDGRDFYERLKDIAMNARAGESQKAIMNLLTIIEKERQIEVEEEKRFEDLRRDELVDTVRQQFAELLRRRIIDGTEQPVDRGAAAISQRSVTTS